MKNINLQVTASRISSNIKNCLRLRQRMEAIAKESFLAVVILLLGTCNCEANYRSDLRCGGSFLAPNGEVAECDPVGEYPCCSPGNWCGNTAAHCDCDDCIDYRIPCQKFRGDLRCGGGYLAANGEVAQCNPDGEYPCCSPFNWCGITADHCDCADCADYRSSASEYREDLRCGGNYLAPNGKPAKCDPNGLYPCCSQWNWCGNTADHCKCGECVDFRYSCTAV
ncbi:hypothetical protein HOLleu_14076 [Holothuria leucospilota]|uniref:Chitin-binding type-1 domain-containing protein n=1 Tax=Holothuria leucospilota TaxID=206669 RepID=A0A9Q1C7R3_HOLLE|nr:hypothetical protein HOLleu_14076 [Holothuria leucospilota]